MKNRNLISIPVLGMLFFLSSVLSAQEKIDVIVQVKKDGKVVRDTTYAFTDEAEARQAIKMMEVMSGDHEKMERYNYTSTHGEHGNRTVVFISEDGGETTIRKVQGDTLVWVTEGAHEGEPVKVIKKRVIVGEDPGEGNKKVVKVIVSNDEKGEWNVETKELKHVEEDVYVISGDDAEIELKEIMEEHGHGEHVKVIVVETKVDKKSDQEGDEVLIEKEKSKKKPEKQ